MNVNRSIFSCQQVIAMREADIFNVEIQTKLMAIKFVNNFTVFPAPYTIYDKELVKNQSRLMPINHVETESNTCPDKTALDEICSKSNSAFETRKTNEECLLRQIENRKSDCENNFDNKPFVNLNRLYTPREKSRFDFVRENSSSNVNNLDIFNSYSSTNSLNTTQDSQVEIPNFVNNLICKKVSRFTYFKCLIKDDEDFIYFDRNLIREYSQNNPWAVFIINNTRNRGNLPDELKSLIEKEKLQMVKKFNSA